MPLPVENIDWPPSDTVDALKVIAEWDLWYGGDPDQLAQRYEDNDVSLHGSRSWRFWSRRRPTTSANSRRGKLHVPVAGDIATTSADLLFGSSLDIAVPEVRQDAENPSTELVATQERLDSIIEEGGLLNRLLEAAEECSAVGGIYLRPTWELSVADFPILTHVTPDRAVPTFRFGILTEVTFWRTLSEEDDKTVIRHLEHRSVQGGTATIENALFEGTEDKLGNRIDLGAHPWTAALADRITLPGVRTLPARYVKNMGPARRLRGTYHGRSDFDGIEALFDSIDETWNSWMRDLRLAKARLIVPSDYLERGAPGAGSYFDTDQEIFTPLEMDPSHTEKAGIELVQPEIRYEAHRATLESLVIEAVGKAGYSAQTFGFHGERDQTATEVTARQDKTHRTTSKKQRYWESAVEDVVGIMLAIDRNVLGNRKTKVVRPDIEWPPLDAPDEHRLAETVELLARAEAASAETLVRMQHPDWSDSDVLEEVDKILDARPQPLPNPFDVGGEEIPEDEDDEPEPPDGD